MYFSPKDNLLLLLYWFSGVAMDIPSLKPEFQMNDKAQLAESGEYGVHDLMTNG